MRLLQVHGHHHALAGSQTVGLDHNRRAHLVDIGVGCHRVGKAVVFGRGNAVAAHKGLGEGLGAFQLRGRLGRPENAHAVGTKLVHHTGSQRTFGAHHGHANLVGLGPFAQFHDVGDRQVLQTRIGGSATIARSHIDHLHLGRLRQFPGQRVFTPATADNQNIHTQIRVRHCGKPPGHRPDLPAHPTVFACARRPRG